MMDFKRQYQIQRIAHWDRVSEKKADRERPGIFYHEMIQRYFKFLVPPHQRVLEIGCGHGDLLGALSPSFGLGVDFSTKMIAGARANHPELLFLLADAHDLPVESQFDVIILSDLINDVWDAQHVFENIQRLSHPGTRVILNFYNNLWRIPLNLANKMDWGADLLEQNWFAPHDIDNLLDLSGFEVVSNFQAILLPLKVPYASSFFNRYIARLVPFTWFTLTTLVTARPRKVPADTGASSRLTVSLIVPARNEEGNIENIIASVPELGEGRKLFRGRREFG